MQSVDFTFTFQMCYFLSFFLSFVVEVDVESESMVIMTNLFEVVIWY